jgi:hypothetical protein
MMGGTVLAATPEAYPGGWYRLYRPCELDGLEAVANAANAAPGSLVVTAAWQPKLVLAALSNDASRVWYDTTFFYDDADRHGVLLGLSHRDRPAFVLLDRYSYGQETRLNTSFLHESPWQQMGTWCGGLGLEIPRITAYVLDPGAA